MCPGVLRPWPAEDGLLVRLRTPGGYVRVDALRRLGRIAEAYGDGRIRVTTRANLQVRGLARRADGQANLPDEVVEEIAATGLLPSPAHDVARNVMASPASGLAGGRADVRPVVRSLDALLLATPAMSALPGRFLFLLDDGRGDLVGRTSDVAAVALSDARAQLRVGEQWSDVVAWIDVPGRLAALAGEFLGLRGAGPDAPWHVAELDRPLVAAQPAHPALPEPTEPMPYGEVPGGFHHAVDDGLTPTALADLTAHAHHTSHLVITPWRGILIPQKAR